MRPPGHAARVDDVNGETSERELLALEARYCSHGDTVHYTNPPKIFESCEGSFLYDAQGRPYLDLQMWYSAVNFGYRNPRLNEVVRRQLDRLPQLASQYLHREKIELAAMLGEAGRAEVRAEGPHPFQCRRQPGGRGQPEARAQCQERQEPDVRLRGRISRPHARRLRDHLLLPLSPALRPLRRPGPVRAVPLPFPRPQGHDARRNTATTASSSSSACSRANTTACGTPRPARRNTPHSTSSRSRVPAATSSRRRTTLPG